MARLKAVTQSHYLIQSPELPDFFATKFSGFDVNAAVTKYPDGQQRTMNTVKGIPTYEDLELSAPYSEALRPLFDRLMTLMYSEQPIKISATEVTSAMEPTFVGTPYSFFGCEVFGVKIIEADRSSSDVSLITFKCTVGYIG